MRDGLSRQGAGIVGRRSTGLFTALYARYRRLQIQFLDISCVRLEAFDLLSVGEQSFDDLMRILKASD